MFSLLNFIKKLVLNCKFIHQIPFGLLCYITINFLVGSTVRRRKGAEKSIHQQEEKKMKYVRMSIEKESPEQLGYEKKTTRDFS